MNPLLKVAVLGAALSVGAGAGPAALAQSWTFGLFGDLAYQSDRETLMQNVVDDMNRTPMNFVAHVGDWAGARFLETAHCATDRIDGGRAWTERMGWNRV